MAQRWVQAGLARARMEGRCVNEHVRYLKSRGWAYCPWCSAELVIRITCEQCGHDYMSEAAYNAHRLDSHLYKTNPCPNQLTGGHAVKYLARRNAFYCQECCIEYPSKDKQPAAQLRGEPTPKNLPQQRS